MGTGGGKTAKTRLVAQIKLQIDPTSLAEIKTQIQRVLADAAKSIGSGQGVSREQAQQLVNAEKITRATREREAAEVRLATAQGKSAAQLEKLAQIQQRTASQNEKQRERDFLAQNRLAENEIKNIQKAESERSRASSQNEKQRERELQAQSRLADNEIKELQKTDQTRARVAAQNEKQREKDLQAQTRLADNEIKELQRIEKAQAQAQAAAAKLAQQKQVGTGRNIIQAASGNLRGAASGLLGLAGQAGGIENVLGLAGGPLGAAAAVASRAATEIIKAYNVGQDYLRQVSLTQREVGLSARQASVSRSFSAQTQNPDSPFANITTAQVQGNLEALVQIEKGFAEVTPPVAAFRDALNQLGLSYKDNAGNAKEVTNFTIELASALEKLKPGEYARIGQQIGGLFGKDFLAVAGTGRANLEQLAVFATNVSQKQVDLANERAVALQLVANAERDAALAATSALAPIDLQLQKTKQIALLGVAASFSTSGFDRARLQQLQSVAQGRQQIGTGLAQNFTPGQELDARRTFLQGQVERLSRENAPLTNVAGIGQLALAREELADVNKQIKEYDANMREATITTKSIARQTREYKDGLKELDAAAKAGIAADKERIELNKDVAASFTGTLGAIRSAADGYDDFYKRLKDNRDKIDEIRAKANEQVEVTTINGQKAKKGQDVNDILNLIDDQRIADASELDDAAKLRDAQGDLADKMAQEAGQAAHAQQVAQVKAQRAAAAAAKRKPGTAAPIPGAPPVDTFTAADAEREASLVEKITFGQAGGSSFADIERERAQQADRDRKAQALGFANAREVNVGAVSTAFQARGTTAEDAQQLQAAAEEEYALQLEDRKKQFDFLQASTGAYLEQQANLELGTKSATEAQKEFNDAAAAGAHNLDTFGKAAGLFDSAGFSRAILEQSLKMGLLTGQFGAGAEGLDTFSKKSTEAFAKFNEPAVQDAITGRKALTLGQASDFGLIGGGDDSRDQARAESRFARLADEGKLKGALVVEEIGKAAGVSIEGGIAGALKAATGTAVDEGTKAATAYDEAFKKVFADPYSVQFKLDQGSLTDARQQIAALLGAASDKNFVPPSATQGGAPVLPSMTPRDRLLDTVYVGPGRALGGDVSPGGLYPINERGAEGFMPSVPGSVIDHNTMYRLGMSAQRPVNIHTNSTSNVYNSPINVTLEGDAKPPGVEQSYAKGRREATFITDGLSVTLSAEQRRRYI